MSKDFNEINRSTNLEIQKIADMLVDGTATERDRNRLAAIIYPKLQFYVKNFFNNEEHHADEALHNTIEKIFKNMHQYNNDWKFTTWIYNIAKNEALLYRDKLNKRKSVDIETVTYIVNTVDDSENVNERENDMVQLYKLTMHAIESMDESIEKEIIMDREIRNMKGAEISVKHAMNLNTVKTKLRKARRAIRENVLRNNPQFAEIAKTLV